MSSYSVCFCIYNLAGPVVMDLSGFTEQGFKRKLAVQALFGKILYLSEVTCRSNIFLLFL
jgi:hypothetical protein